MFPIDLVLVLCFTACLFWCGDADWTGQTNEDCASLICSLLNKDKSATQNSIGGNSKNCSCVCHTPTVTTNTVNLSQYPTQQQATVALAFETPSTPARCIFRPPIAS